MNEGRKALRVKGRTLYTLLLKLGLLISFMIYPGSIAAESVNSLPSPARLVLSKYSVLMNEEKYGEAVELLLSFQAQGGSDISNKSEEDPRGFHHPEIYFALGNGYLVQEQFDLAAKAFQRALEKDPSHTLSCFNMAKALYEQDKYTEAAICFLRGYESSNDKPPERLYHSAASYLMAEEYAKSIEIFERLIRDHPLETKPEWKENMVHALLITDKPWRALPIIKEIIGAYEGDQKVRWQEILLYQYLQLDMREQALAYAVQLTNEYPDNPKWWKALAHIHLSKEDYMEALVAMTIYGLLTPLNQQETELLADLNMKLGIPAKAIFFYEAALAHNLNERIIQNLVTAYQHIEQYDMALNRLEDIDPSKITPDLSMLKGDLLYAMGRYKEAEESFWQTAMAGDDKAGRAWIMAGYAAWQSDNLAASKYAFKKATDFPKQKKSALEALEKMKNMDAR